MKSLCTYVSDCVSKTTPDCNRQNKCIVAKFYKDYLRQHLQIARFYNRYGFDWKERYLRT